MAEGASFYNQDALDPKSLAMIPYEESPWRTLYDAAVDQVDFAEPIIDLGCGTGRFAKALQLRGHQGGYLGLDFAGFYLGEAEKYLDDERYRFEQVDITTLSGFNVRDRFVCLEVLEHLDGDLSLLTALPGRSRIIFSVPNYISAAHVRYFNGLDGAKSRYRKLLTFQSEREIVVDERRNKSIYLYTATRRA